MFLILKKKRKCPSGLEIPGVGFLFPSFLPTPSPVEATPGRAPVLRGGEGGGKGIMLICFFPLLLMVQHKKHLFSQTLIIHKDHFQRDIRRVCVGGIQKRMCCVFLIVIIY